MQNVLMAALRLVFTERLFPAGAITNVLHFWSGEFFSRQEGHG
jgi:hypothetical protein